MPSQRQGRKATCNLAAVRSNEEHHHHNNHQHHRGGLASPVGHTVYTSPMPPASVYTMIGAQPMPLPPASPAESAGQQSQVASSASIAERKLFVRGLPWETTDESLHEEFQKYGELDEASVARDRKTGKSKGYGFVTFKHKVAADRALAQPQKFIDVRVLSLATLLLWLLGRRRLTSWCCCLAGAGDDVQFGDSRR